MELLSVENSNWNRWFTPFESPRSNMFFLSLSLWSLFLTFASSPIFCNKFGSCIFYIIVFCHPKNHASSHQFIDISFWRSVNPVSTDQKQIHGFWNPSLSKIRVMFQTQVSKSGEGNKKSLLWDGFLLELASLIWSCDFQVVSYLGIGI